ncbi:hypothetical protein [Nocardia sp. CA-145437]|uniref:hypothetical protein n=1 Tax=unclassified Nocardia TaxID=2637762 RepID=UPI003D966439
MGFAAYRLYLSAMVSLTGVAMVPVALLLAFGPRPDTLVVAPDSSLVSSAAECVMFCDQPTLAAPSNTAPAKKSDCAFFCDEPPMPSHDEICRLFSGQKEC